jgi:N-methylhydantoinase A
MANWLLGIDIGGTFTDVAAFEADSQRLLITKVPSTPTDPSWAVLDGLQRLTESAPDLHPAEIRFFAHGTTVATNALLEMKGAKVGLLITRGFRAVYELRGGTRPSGSDLIDTFYQKPAALVPQKLTYEIGGRLAADGREIEPLDEEAVRTAARRLREQGVDSIAVCYLFSFMNPAHEQRTAAIIREEHPGCRVSLSSVVLPVIREYQRISTTVLDAYVGPVIESYLRRLSDRLREAGVVTPQVFIMQSNGGLMRIDLAANYPNQTLLSGPAAGVVFGAWMGELTGEHNVVTFDMGGTSTDISVMPEDRFQETRQGRIAGQDIGTPMIQIRTLGAGGGTIAWIGPDGLLKAGPHSAGASPGPACYGLGGQAATVTDANVVLGYLNPEYFVGGRLTIDPQLSEAAIQRIAQPLGLSVPEAALGIIRVVNVTMEVGLRLSLIERGLDHRKFALVAFGGAGPMHATRVARNVGIPRVIVPPYPGISCAMGLLQTDVKHYYLQSRLAPLLPLPAAELNALFAGLEERALEEAREEGFDPAAVELYRQLDLRYPYQGYELTVPCRREPLTEADKELIRRHFDRLHQEVYGISAPDEVPEVVNVRVLSVSRVPKLRLPEWPAGGESAAAACRGMRRALFEETGEYVATPVYLRDALRAGNVIQGPAIVEQLDATTVILPRQRAVVDRYGSLVITIEA